ncbi:MAG: hypothetical protein KF758_04450 [Anaerolineales bacterium]|nr:hypothetical protein [Anaerolineales bacterium]
MATNIPPAIAKIALDGNLTPRQIRRMMIDMVLRKGKSGTGSSDEFMHRRTAMNPWPDLRPILKDVEWAIVGGVATRAYMPERMTKDLDILVHEKDGEKVIQLLQEAGYQLVSKLAISGYVLHAPDGTELDVLLGKDIWLKKALSNVGKDSADYPVLRLPYLILMKLQVGRTQDWADVSRMLGWAEDKDLDKVRAVVKEYSPEDAEDLESLIFIGKKEKDSSENS